MCVCHWACPPCPQQRGRWLHYESVVLGHCLHLCIPVTAAQTYGLPKCIVLFVLSILVNLELHNSRLSKCNHLTHQWGQWWQSVTNTHSHPIQSHQWGQWGQSVTNTHSHLIQSHQWGQWGQSVTNTHSHPIQSHQWGQWGQSVTNTHSHLIQSHQWGQWGWRRGITHLPAAVLAGRVRWPWRPSPGVWMSHWPCCRTSSRCLVAHSSSDPPPSASLLNLKVTKGQAI